MPLFQQGKLSFGKAREMAGVSVWEFQQILGSRRRIRGRPRHVEEIGENMSIVSNASPIISLARIGKLDLLHQLYGELIVPEAVWDEVVVKGIGQPGANDVKKVGAQRAAPLGR